MKKGSYIYDFILFALITSLIFGLMGNGAQPVRLLIIALSPFVLTDVFSRPHKSIYDYRYECFFLLFWFAWALSFFYKAVDVTESAKHLIYLPVHMMGFLEALWAATKARDPQRTVRYGWLVLIALSIPVAVYEFFTDFHLPMAFQDSGETLYVNGIHIERPFASVTFGNLNSYNTVLCWALPSLFMCNLYPVNKKEQTVGMLLMALVSLIIVANASRGAILCLGLMLLTYVVAYYRLGRNRIMLIVILMLGFGAMVYYLGEMFLLIIERFSDQGMEDTGRLANIVQGAHALSDSWGLGIGIGNYEPIMNSIYHVDPPAPHNLFLEVLVLFGLPIFIGFLGMYLHLARIGFSRGTSVNRDMLGFCMAATLLAGVVDSNYVMKATTWMFLASAYIYVDSRYNCTAA